MKIVLIICVLFGAISCNAQLFTLDEKIKPTELKLTDFAGSGTKEKGEIAIVNVTQRDEVLYYFVKGISILSPVVVYVESNNKADKLDVSLHKDFWTEVQKSGTTDAAGLFSSAFKTGGGFGIRITSKNLPAKYQVLVWVGEEVIVGLPSPFKKQKGQGNSKP